MGTKIFCGIALLGIIALAGCESPDSITNESTAKKASDATNTAIDFDVVKPASFDGDFNPEGLEVGTEVGKLAPEIIGEDLDGVAFKLSDYRGKVVMLDFYGDW